LIRTRAAEAPAGTAREARARVEGESGQTGLLSALRLYRDYRQLWLSTVLSQIGQWMLQITLGWMMLTLTDSAAWVGLISFASGVPFLLISIPAGVLIDRVDRRLILLVCQGSAMLVGFGLAVLVTLGHVQPWHLLLAAFLNGSAFAINNATRQTLVPSFVRREHLQNAIAVMSAGQNCTRILGPSLGGPLIALLGAGGTLYIQAAFLLAALLNTMMLPSVRPSARALLLRSNLVDGFRYIARSPELTGLMILATVPSLLIFPYIQFLTVYARDILKIGADGLGLLLAAGGMGAVLGSLLVAGSDRLRSGVVIIGATVLYGLVLMTFAYSGWLPLSLVLLFSASVLGAGYMALNNTLLHMHVTDDMRGRVMGVYMLTWGLNSVGALPMGLLGDRIGVANAIALEAGLTVLIIGLLGIRSRAMRAL
jgi:MFS family permease